MMRLTATLLAAITILALLLTACGDDSTDIASLGGKQSNDASGLEAAVKGRCLGTKDVYQGFSKACRDQVPYTKFAASMTVAKGMVEGILDVKWDDLKIDSVETRNVADGKGEARAHLVDTADPDIDLNSEDDDWSPYAYEDGHWVETDCDSMLADFGDATVTP